MVERAGKVLPASVDVNALGHAILEAAHGARIGVTVTLVEPPEPRCVYVNEAAAEILGWPAETLLAKNPLSHVAPEDAARVRERFERRSAGEQGEKSYQLTVIRRDGRRATIDMTASSATMDGRTVIFAFMVDVTARVEAERSRLRTEAQFRGLMEIAPEPFGIIRGARFVFANAAYAKVLGYDTVEELYQFDIADRVRSDEVERLQARGGFILAGGQPQPTVYHVRRRDGTIVQLEASSGPCEFEGRPAIVTMARDVSARMALEAQLVQADRLAAIGTIAAGVAHEVNNPLAYLMLNLEWIGRKMRESAGDPGKVEGLIELLDEAHRGAERVASIVRELRTFSRADGETRQPVDLAVVAQSAIKIAGHEIRHRARVVTSFEPAGRVWGNESRLEQVVLNLLLNAAHAMPEARRLSSNEICVRVRPDGDSGVVLEVSDNGEGIAPEALSRIFDPFFTTKPRGVGMGLGLSICHGIVTSLGGRIAAHSSVAEGTTFRIALPTTDREDTEVESASAGLPSSRRPRARVLVVDDELPIVNTLRELLGAHHDVTGATTVREALAALREAPDFDVIFCDLMMPGMSGIQLYEELGASFPSLVKRVVFMTGGAFTPRAADFLAGVQNKRLEKPFSLALIERIVLEMAAFRGPPQPS